MRSYGQFCGLARALDLVGERWALLVVRDLLLGPKRFTDLQASLPGIGTNVLSTRLRELEEHGVVRRRILPPPAGSSVYELTEYGQAIEPALLALGRWGAMSMGTRTPEQALRSGWLAVALRGFARPEAVPELRCTCEFRLEHGVFHARVDEGDAAVEEGPAREPDVVVETGVDVLVGILAGGVAIESAIRAGSANVVGDLAALERLIDVFRFGHAETAPGAA